MDYLIASAAALRQTMIAFEPAGSPEQDGAAPAAEVGPPLGDLALAVVAAPDGLTCRLTSWNGAWAAAGDEQATNVANTRNPRRRRISFMVDPGPLSVALPQPRRGG